MDLKKLHAAAKELANDIQNSVHTPSLLPEGLVQGIPTREQVLKILEPFEQCHRSRSEIQVRISQ